MQGDRAPTANSALPLFELGYDVAIRRSVERRGDASRVGLDDAGWVRRPAQLERQAGSGRHDGVPVPWAPPAAQSAWSLYVFGRASGRSAPHPAVGLPVAPRDTAEGYYTTIPAAPIALMGDWNIARPMMMSEHRILRRLHARFEPERRAFNAINTRNSPTVCSHPGTRGLHLLHAAAVSKKQGTRIDFILGSPALMPEDGRPDRTRGAYKQSAPATTPRSTCTPGRRRTYR